MLYRVQVRERWQTEHFVEANTPAEAIEKLQRGEDNGFSDPEFVDLLPVDEWGFFDGGENDITEEAQEQLKKEGII